MTNISALDVRSVLMDEDPTPKHIVDGLLYEGQMVVIAGEPGVGKSFLMHHLAMCIAAGLPFLGMKSVQGKVLYFDEENSPMDLHQYLRWAWRGLGSIDLDILNEFLHVEHFALMSAGTGRYDYMRERVVMLQPSLIIVDTTTPACDIKDENDNAEASRAIARFRGIRVAGVKPVSLILLKHSKIIADVKPGPYQRGEQRTIRGAKAWLGSVDSVMYQTIAPGQPRKNGLKGSRLIPDKTRAFGLHETIKISPSWIGDKGQQGLVLKRMKD